MSKGLFHDLIVEEYEKRKKNLDVVKEKRKQFNGILMKANDNMQLEEYALAKDHYGQILKLLVDDPYPDEYNIPEETLFTIKCCYGYSFICSIENFEKTNKTSLKIIEKFMLTLLEAYPNELMAYYLKLQLKLKKLDYLSATMLCIIIQVKHKKHDKGDIFIIKDPSFKLLLPNVEEIMEFQKKMLKKCLEELSNCDVKKILKYCRIINKFKNMAAQTDKTKTVNKYLQTDAKSFKNSEVQVNLELQEYNLQLIAAESKYRDTITAHDNVLREFKNKLTAADIDKAQLILDKELLKTQCDQLRNENNEIRANLERFKAEKDAESTKNEKRVKFILDLIDQKYNLRKLFHESQSARANFMLNFLRDVQIYLNANTIPTDLDIQQDIEIWTSQLMTNNLSLERLTNSYKVDKTKLIQSFCSDLCVSNIFKNWPDLPQSQKDCDSIVFKTYKPLIIRRMELESQLQEMRKNIADFHQYPQVQFEPAPAWIPHKRKLPGSSFNMPSQIGIPTSSTFNTHMAPHTSGLPAEMYQCSTTQQRHGRNYRTSAPNKAVPWPNGYQVIQPAFPPSQPLQNPNPLSFNSTVTSAHPAPLFSVSAPPVKMPPNVTVTNKKKRGDSVSQSKCSYMIEHFPTTSRSTFAEVVAGRPQNNSGGQIQNPQVTITLSHLQQNVASATTSDIDHSTVAMVADFSWKQEVSEPGDEYGNRPIRDDGALFHYIFQNCKEYTEEKVALAMLRVLDNFGGTFDNVPRVRILENTQTVLRTNSCLSDISEQCCTICFEEYSTSILHTLACKHMYHKKCIIAWLRKSSCCPICRKPSVVE